MRTANLSSGLVHYFVEPYQKGAKLIRTDQPTLILPRDSSNVFLCIDRVFLLLIATQKVAGVLLIIPLINTAVQLIFDGIGIEFSLLYNQIWYIQNDLCGKVGLSSRELSDENIDCLLSALKKSKQIKYLNLSHNKIGDSGAKKIAELLKTHPTLEWLNLSNNCIKDDGVKAIAESLKTNSKLVLLNLVGNTFEQRTGR